VFARLKPKNLLLGARYSDVTLSSLGHSHETGKWMSSASASPAQAIIIIIREVFQAPHVHVYSHGR
jgi:hypothetical protein